MSREVMNVPLADVRENPVALRSVDRESEEVRGLVDSIKQRGIMNAVSLRRKQDKETGNDYYEIIDGLHRVTCAKEAGLETIPAIVMEMDDASVLEAQIIANIHKVETRPVDYSKQLRRILTANPLMTAAELASKLGKSPTWIDQRLGLTKIVDENIQALINDSKINLSNAYALAKLPPEEQLQWVERAMTDSPDVFVPDANARVKAIRDAAREGRAASPTEFQPTEHMRKLKELKDERAEPSVGPALVKDLGIKSPVDAFALAINWMLHMDPKSQEEQKAKHEARLAEKEEAKVRRKAERAAERKKKAAEEEVKAQEEAEKKGIDLTAGSPAEEVTEAAS